MPQIMIISAGSISATDRDGDPTELGSVNQGAGSHLGTVTINSDADFQAVQIDDSAGRSDWFEDSERQELGEDTTVDGVDYGEGTLVEAEFQITLQDAEGNTYKAWAVEVEDGAGPSYDNVVGLIFEQGNVPPFGVELSVVGNVDLIRLGSNNTEEFQYSNGVPCFTSGTMIDTPTGPRPIESLQAGDLVSTRDNGPKELRWIAHRALSASELHREPHLKPVVFEAGSVTPNTPVRRTRLSPQHRVLISGPRIELCFDHREVFIKAKHLIDGETICWDDASQGVTYFHMLFDDHEIVLADGMWSESFFPGSCFLRGGDAEIAAELAALFPDQMRRFSQSDLARPELRKWEAELGRGQLN